MKFRFHPSGVLLLGGLCCALSFALAGDDAVPNAAGDDAVPKGYPVERYAVLWEHSPFTMVSTAPMAPQAGFAQNLAVVGIAKFGDHNLVTLVDRKSMERMTIDTDADAHGIKVVSVETDPDPLKTKVTIQKGSEVATVGFDKSLLAMIQTPPPATVTAATGNPAGPADIAPGPPSDVAKNDVPPPVYRRPRIILAPNQPGAASPAPGAAQSPPPH